MKFTTEDFSWHPQTFTLATEISTLQVPIIQLVMEGLVLQSHRTGNEEAFYHADTITDSDGDPIEWVFKPIRVNLPAQVVIFND